MDYRAAAEAWKSDTHENPDGWYADPEAVLGVFESVWEPGVTVEEVTEAFRKAWRWNRDKFYATGKPWYAGMMVALEERVAKGVSV